MDGNGRQAATGPRGWAVATTHGPEPPLHPLGPPRSPPPALQGMLCVGTASPRGTGTTCGDSRRSQRGAHTHTSSLRPAPSSASSSFLLPPPPPLRPEAAASSRRSAEHQRTPLPDFQSDLLATWSRRWLLDAPSDLSSPPAPQQPPGSRRRGAGCRGSCERRGQPAPGRSHAAPRGLCRQPPPPVPLGLFNPAGPRRARKRRERDEGRLAKRSHVCQALLGHPQGGARGDAPVLPG